MKAKVITYSQLMGMHICLWKILVVPNWKRRAETVSAIFEAAGLKLIKMKVFVPTSEGMDVKYIKYQRHS